MFRSFGRVNDCRFGAIVPCVALLLSCSGCFSVRNGWLDPTTVGDFSSSSTMEIRQSLSLEDTPPGISGATRPTRDDLEIIPVEHIISPGDNLTIEIAELRQRFVPFQAQMLVSAMGYVNIPVIGRVPAAGYTVPEFEDAIVLALQEGDLLHDPDVTVHPQFLQRATYSIFGIGVSASNNAPLRAGTFPIRRPDLRLLEAINQVGGLNEFVRDIYIFRYDQLPSYDWMKAARSDEHDHTELSGDDSTLPDEQPEKSDSSNDIPSDTLQAPNSQDEQVDEEAAIIEAVTEDDEETTTPDVWVQEIQDIAPDPTPPFLYVNNEFVPNPEYEGAAAPPVGMEIGAPSLDAPSQAAQWARIAGDSTYRVLHIPAEPLRDGDPEMDVVVRPGDVIRIVSGEIGVYYVMGQVNRVGPFTFNSEEITLKAAIASAGGLSQLAWPERCTIYRRLGQREQMLQINLDRVFAGKDADVAIRRGDIINVGTHPFAPFLQRIRTFTLPTPANTVGYSFTYARNFADIDSFSVKQNPANQPDRFPLLFP